MPARLPRALRERILAASEREGSTISKVADTFQIGTATLKRLRSLKRETGHVEPRPRRNGPPSKRTPERLEQLRTIVAATPDRFLHELAEDWSGLAGIRMTKSDVIPGLKDLDISWKKRRSERQSRTNHMSRRSGPRMRPGPQG